MIRITFKNNGQKHFLIHSYQHLWQLEEAIQEINKKGTTQLQLSVLGKLTNDCISNHKEALKAKAELKRYWKGTLGIASDFGLFCNPEIGTLFIAGTLVSQFLSNLNGKALGEMASGPYGILRGLGISKNSAATFIEALNERHYLLIIRGYGFDLKKIA